MTGEEVYNKYKGKVIPCIVNDQKGNSVKGCGTVCGYKDKWLILGFDTPYEGCVKEFTSSVCYTNIFKSYRFHSIEKITPIKGSPRIVTNNEKVFQDESKETNLCIGEDYGEIMVQIMDSKTHRGEIISIPPLVAEEVMMHINNLIN